nr:putative ran guanine nucleotide release factor [Quercus suber]
MLLMRLISLIKLKLTICMMGAGDYISKLGRLSSATSHRPCTSGSNVPWAFIYSWDTLSRVLDAGNYHLVLLFMKISFIIITHTTSLHLNANPHPIKSQIHKTANFHKLATPFSHSLSLSLISLRFFIIEKKIKMSTDLYSERPLYGGAISSTFPNRFQDVSNIRQVPDHQEVFVDPARDESLIFELLDLKHEVGDDGSAVWFLQDLATEQEAEGGMVIEQSGVIEAPGLCYRNIPAVVTTAVGQMAISKGRQGREAQNVVKVYLANLRLKEVGTDVLITAYEPLHINPLSESASAVGAGLAVPATQAGCMPMGDVFRLAVSSFKVNDWNLFGSSV